MESKKIWIDSKVLMGNVSGAPSGGGSSGDSGCSNSDNQQQQQQQQQQQDKDREQERQAREDAQDRQQDEPNLRLGLGLGQQPDNVELYIQKEQHEHLLAVPDDYEQQCSDRCYLQIAFRDAMCQRAIDELMASNQPDGKAGGPSNEIKNIITSLRCVHACRSVRKCQKSQ